MVATRGREGEYASSLAYQSAEATIVCKRVDMLSLVAAAAGAKRLLRVVGLFLFSFEAW